MSSCTTELHVRRPQALPRSRGPATAAVPTAVGRRRVRWQPSNSLRQWLRRPAAQLAATRCQAQQQVQQQQQKQEQQQQQQHTLQQQQEQEQEQQEQEQEQQRGHQPQLTGGLLPQQPHAAARSSPWQPPPDISGSISDSVHDVVSVALRADNFKEESRKFRRTVFSFDQWRQHRSTERHLRHAIGMPSSRMVWGLAQPLAYVIAVSVAVALYHEGAEAGLLPVLWPDTDLNRGNAFGTSSFALSLLLVFRTNASYSRWKDARKAWATIEARCKDLARQVLTYIPDEREELQAAACRWLCAYGWCLMCALREDSHLQDELQHVLLQHELEAVLAARNRPAYALQVLSRIIASADMPAARPNIMDANLTQLQEAAATCGRILHSPIPLSYTRHTSRFMMLWLTVLPFTMWDTYRWASIPVCGLVAFLLLGIEEIGVSIEEPFSILPLEAILADIESSVAELHSGASGGGCEMSAAAVVDATAAPAVFPTAVAASRSSDMIADAGGSGGDFEAASACDGDSGAEF